MGEWGSDGAYYRKLGGRLVQTDPPGPRCEAIRRDGQACRGYAMPNGRCFAHQDAERQERCRRDAAWWRLVDELESDRVAERGMR